MILSHKTKIGSIVFFAITSLSAAYANSCGNLVGTWQGTSNLVQYLHSCHYKVNVNVSKINSTFVFIGSYKEAKLRSSNRCPAGTFMLSGTCHDNTITLEGATGTIAGNAMTLEKYTHPSFGEARLFKVGP